MKKFLTFSFQTLLSTSLLFVFLEVIFRFVGVPGARKYIENVIVREHLTLRKPKGEFRIFTYGESTMYGAHYGPVSNPSRWLEVYLKDFLPDKRIRIVNFSRMGVGSDFVWAAFRDTVYYKPDLAIFYSGHNLFLPGARKDQVLREKSTLRFRFSRLTRYSYFISTVSRWVISFHEGKKAKDHGNGDSMEYPTVEVQPKGYGPENFVRRTEPFYWENLGFFKDRLGNIVKLAKKKKIPVLFLKPVCNLKDFSPTQSEHLRLLTPDELSRWQNFYDEGTERQHNKDWNGAIRNYGQAYKIDPTYAKLEFRMGESYLKKGDQKEAKKFFEEARDNDLVIIRATHDVYDVLEELHQKEGLPLMDTEKALLPEVSEGILGEPVIEDNVHLSLRGHSLVALQMAQEISERNWIAPKNEWHFERERSYDEIAKELGIDNRLLLKAYWNMNVYFGSRYENRIRFAEKALKLAPEDPRSLRYLAWAYWLEGDKQKAFEVYRQLGTKYPNALREVLKNNDDLAAAFLTDYPNYAASVTS